MKPCKERGRWLYCLYDQNVHRERYLDTVAAFRTPDILICCQGFRPNKPTAQPGSRSDSFRFAHHPEVGPIRKCKRVCQDESATVSPSLDRNHRTTAALPRWRLLCPLEPACLGSQKARLPKSWHCNPAQHLVQGGHCPPLLTHRPATRVPLRVPKVSWSKGGVRVTVPRTESPLSVTGWLTTPSSASGVRFSTIGSVPVCVPKCLRLKPRLPKGRRARGTVVVGSCITAGLSLVAAGASTKL